MNAELSLLASEITKNLLKVGGRLLEETITRQVLDHRRMEEHLRRTTNQVGYFITYRPSRQPIESAYVQPWLYYGSLSLSHLPVPNYEAYVDALEQQLRTGERPTLQRLNQPGVREAIREIETVDLTALVESQESIIVLAEAGAGKTSLLSFLCFSRLKQKKARLPLFVNSQMLDKEPLSTVLTSLLEPIGLSLTEGKQLGSGIALYLDGLDEISRSRFKKLCAEIRELSAQAPDLCITVSCRSAAYHGELSHLREVSIYPFDRRRSEAFVRAWFNGSGSEHLAQSLIQELRKSERLSDLGRQPLMLSLMCNAFRRYMKVSRRLSALFDQCINALLFEWDSDRDVSRSQQVESIDLQKALWLHSRIAVTLHQSHERFVSLDRIKSILVAELPRYGVPAANASLVLEEFCANSGILVKFTQDTYGFSHLALQEFLASKWFASETRWKQLVTAENIIDPWWREVITLCAASLSDATDMLTEMTALQPTAEITVLSRIASCLRQDPPMDPNLRERLWRQVLFWYHNGDIAHHDAACEMLAGVEDEWSVPLLVASLGGRVFDRASAELFKRGPAN